jgi:hypothetical protein
MRGDQRVRLSTPLGLVVDLAEPPQQVARVRIVAP